MTNHATVLVPSAVYGATVDWLGALNADLLKGPRGAIGPGTADDPRACPIARALNDGIVGPVTCTATNRRTGKRQRLALPPSVVRLLEILDLHHGKEILPLPMKNAREFA